MKGTGVKDSADLKPWAARIAAVALMLWAGAALPQTVPAQRWPAEVQAALRQANVPFDALAVVVLPTLPPMASGPSKLGRFSPRWLHQADKPMQPASTMKLVTSVVALDQLGITHRGFTEVLSAAPLEGDVLRAGRNRLRSSTISPAISRMPR